MPRQPRPIFAGGLYHVTSRGNRREAIYWDDDDRRWFLRVLSRVVTKWSWRCHAFCLMTNHYHLLVETREPTLADGMQQLNGRYARDFNWKYGLRGHLFERRYDAIVVEEETHLLEVARYIVLNPVRAGICATARGWRWSSFAAMTGRAPVPELLTVSWLHDVFGPDRKTAIRRFDAFVADATETAVSGAWHRTRPHQPKPYVPGKRSAKSRTSSAVGSPTTFR